MPSLLKDRATGRLRRLISALRPARAGPLPVQTGFPTSLADLFVKNHGRLRKPSSCASAGSRRKKRGAPPSPSPPPSPAPSPPASSPPAPTLPPPSTVSPPTQPRPELPPAAEPVCQAGEGGGAYGLGLGFLALVGVVLSLAILVIWSRRVVAAAVTVTAFSLFLLDPIRSFSLRRKPRPPATREALDLGGRGYVSPIREVEVEAEPEPPGRSCSDSDRWTDVASILSTEDSIEERIEAGDDSGSSRGKAKRRSWRKLIPRRLQKGRIRKEDASSSLSSSFRSESSDADVTVGGSATRATDRPDSRRGSGRHQADGTVGGNARATDHPDSRRGSGCHQAGSVAGAAAKSSDPSGPRRGTGAGMDAEVRTDGGVPIGMDASSADHAVPVADGIGGSRLPFGAAVVVVLVGLVAGRLPAVAFTVLFVSSLQRLSCGREGR